MTHLQTLTGHGIVTSTAGKTQVTYRLSIYQRHAEKNLPETKCIHGRIVPHCGQPGETLTLQFGDGKTKAKFFFSDKRGTAVLDGSLAEQLKKQGQPESDCAA